MSRRELAEAVNAYLWRNLGLRREIDAHTIARYERGVVRWPGKDYRTALCAILDATAVELGFVANRQKAQVAAQRDVLAVNLISPFDPETIPDDYLPVAGTSMRVGWSDVEKVREIACGAASLENVRGGGPAAETAARHLRALTPLLQCAAAGPTRLALLEAIGNLSGISAYSAFDVADYTVAERQFRFALWCADAAGSWELRAATLADMARKTAYVGNADGALSLIELAQVRSDRLTPTTRAMLCTMRAQFLSTLGRTDEALSEVSRADEHFATRAPECDRPWMCYYDEAEHLGSTGKALIPVAVHRKRIDLAAPRIRQAIELQSPGYPRSRTFSLTRLATLTMTIGEPREAAALGMHAATEAVDFDSQRIRDELGTLAGAAAPYRRIPEVAELTNVIASTANRPVKP
ncbi:MAG: XRE family transcriptional regulator [Nocardia sp.]|nr:XRE family transcriptional regulator [Nocardia sp.]